MPKFTIKVGEVQHWTYLYNVEAKSSEEACHIAESLHFNGAESDDNWLNDAITERVCVFTKEIENA